MELQGIIVVFYKAGSDSRFKGHTLEAVVGLFGREPNFCCMYNTVKQSCSRHKKGVRKIERILRVALLIMSPQAVERGAGAVFVEVAAGF